ncbi:MAG: glucose-6-phosphate isomerase [Pelagibacteraceae bacterium]|nr:glucose-6-phosphate isomerase [Pelagibacteraceae bacterium]
MLFKNNLIKKIKSKNILKTKKKFWELKKDYKEKKITLLTSFEKNYKLSYSKKLVKVLRNKKNIILVGMGGSILGAKVLYSFLKRKIKKKFFFLDNLSEKNILELNSKKFIKAAYIFISKSGNTVETITNVNLIIQNKKNNTKIFITEKTNNAITEIANKLKAEIIEHKNFIGGRYSVMSEVGMLPAELMNLNIKKFKNLNYLINNKNFVNQLISDVSCLYDLSKKNILNSIILNYDPDMSDLGYWYQQLIAESLGKKGKGFIPMVSIMPKDHHSLLQLYLDGPKNNFFTIFASRHQKKYRLSNYLIPKSIKYIAKKNLETILYAQRKAMENALIKNRIPFRIFYFLKKREQELGTIFTFFVLETILLSRLMKLNPFDQPAVENVKQDTKKILLKS